MKCKLIYNIKRSQNWVAVLENAVFEVDINYAEILPLL